MLDDTMLVSSSYIFNSLISTLAFTRIQDILFVNLVSEMFIGFIMITSFNYTFFPLTGEENLCIQMILFFKFQLFSFCLQRLKNS